MKYLQSTMGIFIIKHHMQAEFSCPNHSVIYNYDVSSIGILEMKYLNINLT